MIKPGNLLVFPLSWFDHKTTIIHFVNVASRLHVGQNVVLELWDRLQWVRNILVLLYIPDDFCGLCTLSKVDKVCFLDDRWYAVLDKGQICKVDTWIYSQRGEKLASGTHETDRRRGYMADLPCATCLYIR